MTTKLLGAEWKAFFADPWPDDWYYEDERLTVDGQGVDPYEFDPAKVEDSAQMTLTGGVIHKGTNDHDGHDLERYFKEWRKAQTTEILAVQIPKDQIAAFKAAVKQMGGKIL